MTPLNYTEQLLKEVVEAADRMLAGRGKGMEPSPRLQAAMDEARRALPTAIEPQQAPRAPKVR